jgi:glycosyltransferase involved in cell wall biosynthesis
MEIGSERFAVKTAGEIPFVFVKSTPYKSNSLDRIRNMYVFARNVVKLKNILPQLIGKPDVIIASSVHPLTCIAGLKLGKYYKVPVIVEIRDLWPATLVSLGAIKQSSLIAKILYCGEKSIYKRADAIIFTMEGGRQYIIDKKWIDAVDLGKVFYINNGVDLSRFDENVIRNPVHDCDLSNGEQRNFVYTGSVQKANDLKALIDVFSTVRLYKAKLLIWGSGNEKQQLEEYCKSNNISNVVFKGRVPKKMIPSIVTQSYMNVLHNVSLDVHKYGMSMNKLFEYLASGKPVLATSDYGYNIIGAFECGITSDGTPDDMIEKLKISMSLSKDEYEIMGYNCRQTAELFDFARLTDRLEQVIDFVLSKRKKES